MASPPVKPTSRFLNKKMSSSLHAHPYKTWMSLGLLGAMVGFTLLGNHAQYTVLPPDIGLITGLILVLVFLLFHGVSCRERLARLRDEFHPGVVTPYWIVLIMDVGVVCIGCAATWSAVCFFNAILETEPPREQRVEIVSRHPSHSTRFGSDTVHLAHAAFEDRTLSIPVSRQDWARLSIGQCLVVHMHMGYFHWVWIEQEAWRESVSCQN